MRSAAGMPPEHPGSRSLFRRAATVALAWGLVGLGLVGLAYLAWQVRVLLALLFLAILLATALRRPVSLSESVGAPRLLGVLGVYLVLVVAAILVLWLVVPPLIEQGASFVQSLPQAVDDIFGWLRGLLRSVVPGDRVQQTVEGIQSALADLLPPIEAVLQVPLLFAGILVNIGLIIFLSAFLLLDGRSLFEAVLRYVEPERRDRLREVGTTIADRLGAYIVGQLVVMLVVGVGAMIGMVVLGVPYVLPLGFIAFITEAIPLIGPWIGGAIVVLVAFTVGPFEGVAMAAWYLVLQQLEGNVLVPIVQKRAIEVSPTIVLFATTAGGVIAGILGALLAIPLVAVVEVVMQEVVLPARRLSWGEDPHPSGASSEGSDDGR